MFMVNKDYHIIYIALIWTNSLKGGASARQSWMVRQAGRITVKLLESTVY